MTNIITRRASEIVRFAAQHAAVLGAGVLVCSSGHAHHSPAAFDRNREVRIEGTVAHFAYNNPHGYLAIEVVGADGRRSVQEVEVGPISTIQPLGLTRDSLQLGARVTVRANPNRGGTGTVMGLDVTRADGRTLPLHISAASVRPARTALASSIAGVWLPSAQAFQETFASLPSWPMTERGRDALAEARRTNATTQSECVPAGAPMLMLYPVAVTVELDADAVEFDIDWLGARRVVHLESTSASNVEASLQGHSTGGWEGDVLVVTTTNFLPHAEGLGFGMPSSDRKRLVERFSLEPDRRHLRYDVTVEDAVYLTRPVNRVSLWAFSPDLLPSGVDCDLEAARRYLRE